MEEQHNYISKVNQKPKLKQMGDGIHRPINHTSDHSIRNPEIVNSNTVFSDFIWIIGSSVIHRARKYAADHMTLNLGLTSHHVLWKGLGSNFIYCAVYVGEKCTSSSFSFALWRQWHRQFSYYTFRYTEAYEIYNS